MFSVRKCNLKECQPVRIISWRSNLRKTMQKGLSWPLHFSFHILSLFPTPSSFSSSYFPSSFLLNHPNLLLQPSYHLTMFFTALCPLLHNFFHSPFWILHYKHVVSLLCPLNTYYVTALHKRDCFACLITEINSKYTGTWVVNNSQTGQRRPQVPGQGKGRDLPQGSWQLYPEQKGSLVSLITELEFLLRATEHIRALPIVTVSVL